MATIEKITAVYKKQFYLRNLQSIPLPARSNIFGGAGEEMRDDGLGADVRAQDGVYTTVLEDVAIKPDTYELTVIASGATSNGNAFRRERTIHMNIQPRIDLTLAHTNITLASLDDSFGAGIRRFRAFVQPQDHLGNFWGPGHEADVNISASAASPVTAVIDDLNGGYYRTFEYSSSSSQPPQVHVDIKGESLPTQIVTPTGIGWLMQMPVLFSIILLILVLILLLIVLSMP